MSETAPTDPSLSVLPPEAVERPFNTDQLPFSNPEWSDPTMHIFGAGSVEFTSEFYASEYVQTSVANTLSEIERSDLQEATKTSSREIIEKGTLNGQEVLFDEISNNATADFVDRRYMAELFIKQPDVVRELVNKDVAGFHGTRSAALAGILESGALLSTRALRKHHQPVITGEHVWQHPDGQKSISFSGLGNRLHWAANYAGSRQSNVFTQSEVLDRLQTRKNEALGHKNLPNISSRFDGAVDGIVQDYDQAIAKVTQEPGSLYATLLKYDFPVLLSVTRSFVRTQEESRKAGEGRLMGTSEMAEFRPASSQVPLSEVPVIAVPQAQVEPVTQLLKMKKVEGVTVMSLEALLANEDSVK